MHIRNKYYVDEHERNITFARKIIRKCVCYIHNCVTQVYNIYYIVYINKQLKKSNCVQLNHPVNIMHYDYASVRFY